jgi:hypothetical protein
MRDVTVRAVVMQAASFASRRSVMSTRSIGSAVDCRITLIGPLRSAENPRLDLQDAVTEVFELT